MRNHTERLLRARDLHTPHGILAISRSQLYALISRGAFPKGTRIGENTVVWRESVVWAWVQDRAELFEKFSLAAAASLTYRQRKGVASLKENAAQRWSALTDELVASGMSVSQFVDERWEEGTNPSTYQTRNGKVRGYAAETMTRELLKELKRRRKAIS